MRSVCIRAWRLMTVEVGVYVSKEFPPRVGSLASSVCWPVVQVVIGTVGGEGGGMTHGYAWGAWPVPRRVAVGFAGAAAGQAS